MTDTLVHTVREGLRLTFSVDGSVFEMTRDERENIFAIVDSIRAMGAVASEPPVSFIEVPTAEEPCKSAPGPSAERTLSPSDVARLVAEASGPDDSQGGDPEIRGGEPGTRQGSPPSDWEPEPPDLPKIATSRSANPEVEETPPTPLPPPRSSLPVSTMSPIEEAAWMEKMRRPAHHGTQEGYDEGCRCGPCKAAGGEHVHRWKLGTPANGVVPGRCECGATREDPSDLTVYPGQPTSGRSKVYEAPAKRGLWTCPACGQVTSNRYQRRHREEQCPARERAS